MHSWSIFGARFSHGHTQPHMTHHDFDLGETTTFPLIVFSMISSRGCTQMSFFLGFPSQVTHSQLLKGLKYESK